MMALAQLNQPKYEYQGKKLTEYEASQVQRYNERQIRRWKREYQAMKAAGQDTTEAAAKISEWNKRQGDFLRQTGFKRQQSREEIAGFGLKETREVSKEYNRDLLKSNAGKGIIKFKNSDLPNGLPMKRDGAAVVDKTDDNGVTLQRRFYNAEGLAYKDYDLSDHNRPDIHPMGAHKHRIT